MHDLIFGGGCEDRMVLRLHRETAPRAAPTLEEWFLDTLLVQHNATAFSQGIVDPNRDAWLSCNGFSDGADLILA